jgi:hypothetical protein
MALPAVWTGRTSSQIFRLLLDALLRLLPLDLVYARLKDPAGELATISKPSAEKLTDRLSIHPRRPDTETGPLCKGARRDTLRHRWWKERKSGRGSAPGSRV